jgi:hypothetical protein
MGLRDAERVRPRRRAATAIRDYSTATLTAVGTMAAGLPVSLARDVDWNGVTGGGWSRQAMAVGRGVAIAVPLVFLFGALFVAADVVFRSFVNDLAFWRSANPAEHVLAIAVWGWIGGGFVYAAGQRRESDPPEAPHLLDEHAPSGRRSASESPSGRPCSAA